MTIDPGFGRSYFYRRLSSAMREVIARENVVVEETPREMADRVNLEDAVAKLRFCPCCGSELAITNATPSGRTCECGEFIITSVYLDGDVAFEYTMYAEPPPYEPDQQQHTEQT